MPYANDMELLREYTCRNSDAAFAELVRRHVNLVYSVASRYVGNDPRRIPVPYTRDLETVNQALRAALGLKLVPDRQPIEMLVVEHSGRR